MFDQSATLLNEVDTISTRTKETNVKTPRSALPRLTERTGILHAEYARIAKKGHSVVLRQREDERVVPHASLTAIFAGPGTSITRDAAMLLADAGVTVLWTGSGGVRAYGSVTPLASKANLHLRQVKVWADDEARRKAAIHLYSLRFPHESLSADVLISHLRSREGSRVRTAYRDIASEYGLHWEGRNTDIRTADPLNRALTLATQCLYGATTASILALGCAPSLGIIHTGHPLALSFDLADLFKLDVAYRVACDLVSTGRDAERSIREEMNVAMRRERVLARSVAAIYATLEVAVPRIEEIDVEDLRLWSDEDVVPAGTNYATAPEVW